MLTDNIKQNTEYHYHNQLKLKFINRRIFPTLLILIISLSLVSSISAQTSDIPGWVKNLAGFWSEDAITDQEFLAAIQYLIDNGMLSVSSTSAESVNVLDKEDEIPIEETTSKSQSSTDLDFHL